MMNDFNAFLKRLGDAAASVQAFLDKPEEGATTEEPDTEGDVEVVLTREVGRFTLPREHFEVLEEAAAKKRMSVEDYMLDVVTSYAYEVIDSQ